MSVSESGAVEGRSNLGHPDLKEWRRRSGCGAAERGQRRDMMPARRAVKWETSCPCGDECADKSIEDGSRGDEEVRVKVSRRGERETDRV